MPGDTHGWFSYRWSQIFEMGNIPAASEQQALGDRVRAMLTGKGFKSLAAAGFQAPGVGIRRLTGWGRLLLEEA